jgi:hypothetical protein
MFNFTLDSGHQVSVRSFYFKDTYLTVLLGPNREQNKLIVKNALDRVKELWGNRKIHLIQPETDNIDLQRPLLPPVEITAWIECHTSSEPEFDGSELVVIWYRDNIENEPLYDIIYEGIKSIPWAEIAEDYNL